MEKRFFAEKKNAGETPEAFSLLGNADGALFEAFFRIFEVSFPFEEQRERPAWSRALSEPACRARVYGNAENPCAILVFWHFGHCRYIEYFALDPEMRGGGRGSAILKNFIAEEPDVPVVLEIEPPEDELTTRRLRFYERLGFARCAEEHFHPPYHAGFPRQRLVVLNTGTAPLSPDARERFVADLENVAMRDAPAA